LPAGILALLVQYTGAAADLRQDRRRAHAGVECTGESAGGRSIAAAAARALLLQPPVAFEKEKSTGKKAGGFMAPGRCSKR